MELAEQVLERLQLLVGERVALLAGDHARAHGDGRVGDGAEVTAVRGEGALVEREVAPGGYRDHGFVGKQFAHRLHHLLDEVGLHRQDDEVAGLHHLGRLAVGVHAELLGRGLQFVEASRARVDVLARERARVHEALRHRLGHVAEPDEAELDAACGVRHYVLFPSGVRSPRDAFHVGFDCTPAAPRHQTPIS